MLDNSIMKFLSISTTYILACIIIHSTHTRSYGYIVNYLPPELRRNVSIITSNYYKNNFRNLFSLTNSFSFKKLFRKSLSPQFDFRHTIRHAPIFQTKSQIPTCNVLEITNRFFILG